MSRAIATTQANVLVRSHHGFGLVELMVAMAISIMLLAGVVAIFSSSRSTYETTERNSRIQENGRFALDTILRDIRSSGFQGCARGAATVSTTLANANLQPWNFMDGAVRGFEGTSGAWTPALDGTITSPTAGSDVLVLRGPIPDRGPVRLESTMATRTADIDVVDADINNLQDDDLALISSCDAQAYFQVRGRAGGALQHGVGGGSSYKPGNAVDDLRYAFRHDLLSQAEIVPIQTTAYYLRNSPTTGTPSLWRRVNTDAPEELVEGVDAMEIRYGVDTNGDLRIDTYVDADAVTNWANVLDITVSLLVRSPEEYGMDRDAATYTLLNTPNVTRGPFNDRHMRHVFASTATIRNRVPL